MAHSHLLADISGHGYGHAAMTLPVLNELARRLPELRISVRTTLAREFLDKRMECAYEYVSAGLDFGMVMANALDVRIDESMDAYRTFHQNWSERVQREAEAMRALKPDLVLANVPYLSLAAAHKAGVRAVGFCCLNWADIYHHYAEDNSESRAIHAQMLESYNNAQLFLRAQPAMAMPGLENLRDIGPIARVGQNRRAEMLHALGLSDRLGAADRLVPIAMGGIDFRLPMERWPHIEGVHWLVPRSWGIERADTSWLEHAGLGFSDLLASCDAVLTKPGYGTFAEAACAGKPALYVSRHNWPEEPYLVQWLQQNGSCRELERAALESGSIADDLDALFAVPVPVPPAASGASEAADCLIGLL